MRKLFFTIYFILTLGFSGYVEAKIKEVSDAQTAAIEQNNKPVPMDRPSLLDQFETKADFDDYIRERLRSALITSYDPDSGTDGASATSVVADVEPDPDAGKSIFEKIYENAISRVDDPAQNQPQQPLAPQRMNEYEWRNQPDVDAISVLLPPFDEKVSVPAMEHIPYLFSKIEILPDGLVKFEETVMVVANGGKLKYPLSKVLPEQIITRKGERQKLEVNLIGVKINNQPVAYQVSSRGGNTVIMPQRYFAIEPGVYKYTFSYTINRLVSHYNEFDELYWDVTGSAWNLVVAKAGASVILPPNGEPASMQVFTGYPYHYSNENAIISRDAKNMVGFVTKAPLFVAEGMPLLLSFPKGVVAEPDFSKKISWFISDHGESLFGFLGFLTILIAYLASWRYICKYRKKQNISLKKTPQMFRFLALGVFDKISFAAVLLDWFRKNIIDLQKSGETVLLVKRTDNLNTLNRNEQKALQSLFKKDESVLAATPTNLLKFRQAYDLIARDLQQKFYLFSLKLNAGYLLFSVGMLLLAEFSIAQLYLNSAEVFANLLIITAGLGIFLFMLGVHWSHKWLNRGMKTLSVILILLAYVVMCGVINMWAAAYLVAACLTIKFFTTKYTQRNGLLQANIAEAQAYRNYLLKSSENISLGRDFLNQQANILALDATAHFDSTPGIKDYYRLDLIKPITDLL